MQNTINQSLRMIITKSKNKSPEETINEEIEDLNKTKIQKDNISSPDFDKNLKSLRMLKEK